jgi:NitT/TauT family transport system substrate-binding protein
VTASNASNEIRISPNPPVFDLPLLVGREEKLFEKHGIRLSYSAEYTDRAEEHDRDVLRRLKESLFVEGKADAYNVCEWGGIDRIERGTDTAKIAALRPAIAAQAIISFNKSLQTPRDLADIPVGINEYTGSHYTTLQLLESALGEHVKLQHIGEPGHRYDQVKAGTISAVTVMEPFVSLALKEGGHVIALAFYRGAEIINPILPDEVRAGYFAAINEAVDLINANFDRYTHHIAKATKGRLLPDELGRQFVRYEPIELYAEGKFDSAYRWMTSRRLSHGRNRHADLVAL